MRLATLAPQGRITTELVQAEIARLRWLWQDTSAPAASVIPAKANPDGLDLFDRLRKYLHKFGLTWADITAPS